MIVITPRGKWERMVCVTKFWLKKENGGKCVAERIPITLIGTFLSLQVHCRDALLTRRWWELLVLVLSSKSVVAQVWVGGNMGGTGLESDSVQMHCALSFIICVGIAKFCMQRIFSFQFWERTNNKLKGYLKTLPKAQRTRGLSSACQSNLFRSYHKFLHKSWSDFIFRISTRHQMISISTKLKIQNLDQT